MDVMMVLSIRFQFRYWEGARSC